MLSIGLALSMTFTSCDEPVNTTDEATLIASLAAESTVGTGSAEKAEEAVPEKESEAARESEKPVTEEVTESEAAKTYTVYFNTAGGTPIEPLIIEAGGKIDKPAVAPSRKGFAFVDWYKDYALTVPYNFGSVITQDITLYAKWVLPSGLADAQEQAEADRIKAADETEVTEGAELSGFYTVTFYTEAIEIPPPPSRSVSPQLIVAGHTARRPNQDPDYPGYTFDGWYADLDFTVPYGFDVPVTADTNIYAKWIAKPVTVTSDAPVYGVRLSESGTYTFESLPENYDENYWTGSLGVIVRNAGNQPTGELTVSLSGANPAAFTVSRVSLPSSWTSESFAVRPAYGLKAGIHTATVTVSGDNGIKASFTVSVTVE